MHQQSTNPNFNLESPADRTHVWHPYSAMGGRLPVFPVASASGVRLRLEDGRELIDGMSSWWCAIHGYNHPEMNRALEAQIKSMAPAAASASPAPVPIPRRWSGSLHNIATKSRRASAAPASSSPANTPGAI